MQENNQHEIIYTASYAKQLANEKKVEELKTYIMKFYCASGSHIFVATDDSYVSHKLDSAKMLIANDLVVYEGKNEIFNARKFLSSSEFYDRQYEPAIDFTKPIFFESSVVVRGHTVKRMKLNMAKSLGQFDFKQVIDRNKYGDGLQMIYDHILNVWCSKNMENRGWKSPA